MIFGIGCFTHLSARNAESRSPATGIRTESTAQKHVPQPRARKDRMPMNAEYRERLVSYRTSMALAESMLFQGIISEKDYCKIEKMIAQKCGLSLCSIFCRNPLIVSRGRGNMQHTEGVDLDGSEDQGS
jgi:hypothetical protein